MSDGTARRLRYTGKAATMADTIINELFVITTGSNKVENCHLSKGIYGIIYYVNAANWLHIIRLECIAGKAVDGSDSKWRVADLLLNEKGEFTYSKILLKDDCEKCVQYISSRFSRRATAGEWERATMNDTISSRNFIMAGAVMFRGSEITIGKN